ncbi:hypothetical protein RGQ15_09785 [Paracoccus sp. MBLB3053]|uniref:Uncharacterized protein n=1 Tax=Paracoccus aurantius TaxID=3073814 RepID=A0ABU2HS48_9RHOB|nr:hypothetical protein [Paracoccus sp. MBLB3053]MDS9467858.1 hypothetical protein [Paracoccus sp. MBLB3053]
MFTELLITACLQGSMPAGDCKDFSLLYDARDVSLSTCSKAGMFEVARWSGTHPNWTVKRWRCGNPEKDIPV